MAEDITSLQIQILYDKVEAADRKLAGLAKTGKAAEKGMKAQHGAAASLMVQVGLLAVAYLSVTTIVNQFNSAIATTREFQKLKASLQAVIGDLETTELVWASMLDFAKTTPFELSQSIQAFQQMVGAGLVPTKEAMMAFGDTASALGHSLSSMTEAVSKATVGEFEPLRKFFITAKKEGDEVTFHFKGVATTVKNTSADIQNYFTQLGENNFAGAMAKQMETLEGKFSNLGDAWKTFQYDLMTSTGAADAFGGILGWVGGEIAELSNLINSGQMQLGFDSWTNGFSEFHTEVSLGLASISEMMGATSNDMRESADSTFDEITGSLKSLPSLYVAYVKSVATILWGLVDSAAQIGIAIYQTIKASLDALVNVAWNTGRNMAVALNPFNDFSMADAFSSSMDEATTSITSAAKVTEKAWLRTYNKIDINGGVVAANIKDAWEGAGDQITRSASLSLEADAARETYEKGAEGRAKDRASRLNDYYKKLETERAARGNATTDKPKGGGGGGGGGGGASQSEFAQLAEELGNQEELIADSYAKRLDIIRANTQAGSQYQMELEIAATQKFEEEQRARIEALHQQPERMREAFDMEEQLIRESYERRKEIILAATALTEEKRQELLEQAAQRQRQQEAERLSAYWDMQEETLGEAMGSLAEVAQAFGKKGFAAYKALAMAEAAIAAPQAALQAYLGGLKWSGGNVVVATTFAAIAASAVGVQIAKIASQEYSGEYATGGFIPPGKTGLVGEAGPELVKGPAMVTSAQATWDRKGAGQASPGNNVEIKIINNTGESVQQNRRMEGNREMLEFIIGKTKEAVANDIRKGGTGVSRALEGTYNMGRGSRA